jgi:hypothetical protein
MTALLLICGITFSEWSARKTGRLTDFQVTLYADSSEKVVQEGFPGNPAP